mgnify:CR=1 FL=1
MQHLAAVREEGGRFVDMIETKVVESKDGETVLKAKPIIGYLHTGIEKTCEQKKFQQVVPLVERMDYLGPQSNSLAYCLSVEKLIGLELPDRVIWIRVLIAELQRSRPTIGRPASLIAIHRLNSTHPARQSSSHSRHRSQLSRRPGAGRCGRRGTAPRRRS